MKTSMIRVRRGVSGLILAGYVLGAVLPVSAQTIPAAFTKAAANELYFSAGLGWVANVHTYKTNMGDSLKNLETVSPSIYEKLYGSTMRIGDQAKAIADAIQLREIVAERSGTIGPFNKAFVVHSQGGLKALAYAKMAKDEGYGDSVKAIITIASPVRGFSPLKAADGSQEPDLARLRKQVDEIGGAVTSAVAATIGLPMLYGTFKNIEGGKPLQAFAWLVASAILPTIGEPAFDYLKSLIVPFWLKATEDDEVFSSYLRLYAQNEPSTKEAKRVYNVMKDLTPGSAFLRDYIEPAAGPTTMVRTIKTKQPAGQAPTIMYKRVWFIRIPCGIRWTTTYTEKYYTVRSATGRSWSSGTSDADRLSAATGVGFIVGLADDPLTLVPGQNKQDEAKLLLNGADVLTGGAAAAYSVSSALSFVKMFQRAAKLDIYGCIVSFLGGVSFLRSANICFTGNKYIHKYKETFSSVLGTTEHDCFIPKADQWRPIEEIGGVPIGLRDLENPESFKVGGKYPTSFYYEEVAANHAQSLHDPKIWGANGSAYKGIDMSDNIAILPNWIKKIPGYLNHSGKLTPLNHVALPEGWDADYPK